MMLRGGVSFKLTNETKLKIKFPTKKNVKVLDPQICPKGQLITNTKENASHHFRSKKYNLLTPYLPLNMHTATKNITPPEEKRYLRVTCSWR